MPGHIQSRGNDTWRLIVTIGSDFSGKPKRYTKTVHGTEAEAKKQLSLFYADCERGLVNKGDITTVSGVADAYMKSHVKRYCKKSSVKSYDGIIKVWIDPLLGDRKISKVTRQEIQEWINYIDDKGKSPKTIRNRYSVLKGIFDYAIDMGIIDISPCHNIRFPKKINSEAKYFNVDEVQTLLKAAELLPDNDLRYKCAIYIALFGGLRKAEICGLNWDDVNFVTNELHINRTRMMSSENGLYEDTPKTEKSNRYVTVPEFVISDLKKLQLQQKKRKQILGDEYVDSPAILRGELGGAMSPQVLYGFFIRFCKKNGLPAYGLHALRHTHASMLAGLDINKMQVSTRLGHSQLSTTLNIYTHLFEDADKEIANSLDAFVTKLLPK